MRLQRLRGIALGVAMAAWACATPDPISRTDGDVGPADVAPDGGKDVPADLAGDPAREDGTIADPGEDWMAPDGDAPAGDGQDAPDGLAGDATDDGGDLDASWLPDGTGTPVVRTCQATLEYAGTATSVNVPGDWNDWSPAAHPMTASGSGWSVTIDLSGMTPGSHGYKILVDGSNWMTDPANPLTLWDPTFTYQNSKLRVPDCSLPTLELVSATADWAARTVTAVVQASTGRGGEPLLASGIEVRHQGMPVDPGFDPATQRFTVRLSGLDPGKHSLTFRASTSRGQAEPLFVPLWLEEKPFAWRDAVLYFALTDRFANGDPSNDAPAACVPADQAGKNTNWEGGDWEGLRRKIQEGYFDSLGVTAIWISAPNDNPDGCFGGDLAGATYTAYHAYFPLSLDATENHFGSMDDLRAMTAAAHRRGIRIVMDLDANHVHQDSDLWKAHKEWFHQDRRICGQDDNWNQHPVDCWFQDYLPDFDYRVDDAVEQVTDSAIDWMREADLDGFRVDAVKHMEHAFGYHLRDKVRRRLETSGVPVWLVGETYVGDWQGGTGANEGTIQAYLSDRELTGQFDFPLYWEIVGALARGEGSLAHMAEVAVAGNALWHQAFAGAVMSNFLGNHDIPRFISHASGVIADKWGNGAKELGWNSPPPLPTDATPFLRLRQAFAFLMTIPGVPLIYYGDEVGMPGAGDPDNRRRMTFEGWTENQSALRDAVGALAAFRAAHPATRSGTFVSLLAEKDALAYGMHGGGDAVAVVLNRGEARTIGFGVSSVPGLPADGTMKDALGGADVTVQGGTVSIPMPAQGVVVLAP